MRDSQWHVELNEREIRNAIWEYIERQGYKVELVEIWEGQDKSLKAKVFVNGDPAIK